MANLLASRVRQITPFVKTGLDFAGPFITRPRNKVRDKTHFNFYLFTFVCMAQTRSFGAFTDMTRNCFIACFDPFASARRGYPLDLFSYQGTTFISASKFLRESYRALLNNENQNCLAAYFLNRQFDGTLIP